MKILFILPSLGGGPGGSEKVISQVASAIAADTDNEVFLFTPIRREYYLPTLHERVVYESEGRKRSINSILTIAKKLKSNKYDVVICSAYVNLICGIALRMIKTRSRVIARETTIPSIGVRRWRFPRLIRAIYRFVYPAFDGIICQSEDMAEDLITFAGISRANIRVIRNPYFQQVSAGEPTSTAGWFKSADFPDDVVMTAIGKFSLQKNFGFALESLAELDGLKWRLNLVGDGPERKNLEDQVRDLNLQARVRMLGVSDEVEKVLKGSDYLVIVSQFEGLSNVMIEAICNQVPVIAIPSPGGIREVVGPIPGCIVATSPDKRAFQEAVLKSCKGVRIDSAFGEQFLPSRIVNDYLGYACDPSLEPKPVKKLS